MRTFEPVSLNLSVLSAELDELDHFLSQNDALKERDQVLPFFKARAQLRAALGLTNPSVELPDRIATELELFGDCFCDAASGDSSANAYTLVEFENATEYSIFRRLDTGKTMRNWSPRFEHGFSQLVDWAWRLTTEGSSSPAYRRIFGANDASIHFLLIVGRDADLTADDLARLRWRANNISFGAFKMSCLTFDGVLGTLRRRLVLATQN
jgi:hypothetical protein